MTLPGEPTNEELHPYQPPLDVHLNEGDRVAVQLADGTLRFGTITHGPDPLEIDFGPDVGGGPTFGDKLELRTLQSTHHQRLTSTNP